MLLLMVSLPGWAETVDMRDGVGLATDVWNPIGEGPWPVILRRTPYGRYFDPATVATINLLGYTIVSQDVRGRGESEGEFLPFFNDGEDGVDTVAWIRDQPWSDGHVCMFGGSAEGIVQVLAAGAGAALDCIVPIVTSGDMRGSLFPGGAWRTDLTTNWLEDLGESQVIPLIREAEVDTEFWDPARLDDTELARIDQGVLLMGGFFDIFESELPAIASDLHEVGQGADTWLILGPWTHGGIGGTTQGEVAFPDGTYPELYLDIFAFYDWKMKGGTRPDWAPVRFAVSTFSNSDSSASSLWVEAEAWPPEASLERLYLSGNELGATPGTTSVDLPVDPANPVPSVGGGNLTTAAGPYDQTEVDTRPDVLVASTAPQAISATIAGDASAVIWASSATTDADVMVRVEIVPTNGKAWLVADGVRRGRFVAGEDMIRPLTPGEPARFEINLGPMAFTLTPGQVLRIAISGTLSPRFEPNPNEAVPLADNPTPVSTTLTVFGDSNHPSSVVFPLVAGTLGGVPATDPLEDTGDGEAGGGLGDEAGSGCGCQSRSGTALVVPSLLGLALLVRRRTLTSR